MMRVFLERGEGKHLIPKVDASYNFEVKTSKKGPVVKTFNIDLKTGNGKVSVGKGNADATFTMVDADFE